MYTIEYQKTNHKNADALSRLSSGEDPVFDNEEDEKDVDVCAIHAFESQLKPSDSIIIKTTSMKDPTTLIQAMGYIRGWQYKLDNNDPAEKFHKLSESLSSRHRCLLHGSRLVIPSSI